MQNYIKLLCLILVMTFSCVAIPSNSFTAYAAGSVTVATSSQLKAALADSGADTIIIDETGALSEVANTDENGNKSDPVIEESASNPEKKFYLPVDEPLTVDRKVTIKSKDNKEVIIARSEIFKASDSNPAIFNVTSAGELTLDGKVTMTGDKVTAVYKYENGGSGYDPGQGYEAGQNTSTTLTAGSINMALGGSSFNLKLLPSSTDEFWIEDGLLCTTYNGNTHYVAGQNMAQLKFVEKGNKTADSVTDEVIIKDASTGNTVTSLAPGQNYVLYDTYSRGKYLKRYESTNGFAYANGLSDALVFTAGGPAPTYNDGNYNVTPFGMYGDGRTLGELDYDNRVWVDFLISDGNGHYLAIPKNATADNVNAVWLDETEVITPKTDGSNPDIYSGARWSVHKISTLGSGISNPDDNGYYVQSGNYVLAIDQSIIYNNGNTTKAVLKSKITKDQNNGVCFNNNSSIRVAFQDVDTGALYRVGSGDNLRITGDYDNGHAGLKNGTPGANEPKLHFITANNVIAVADSDPGTGGGSTTGGREYKNVKFKFNVENPAWTESDLPGNDYRGYFIHSDGGKVTINDGATLTGLNTASNVKKLAPVYVGNKGTFTMNGGRITGNTVGYADGTLWNSAVTEQKDAGRNAVYIRQIMHENPPTNTAGGVILSGSGTTAKMTGGSIDHNRADAGGMIVKDGAKLTYGTENGGNDGPGIDSNVGFHHAGAVLVENGATVHMRSGHMKNNVAWGKGGAVWATEWGTVGWMKWNKQEQKPSNLGLIDGRTGGNFVMDGGLLDGNMAFCRAGAIEVESNGVQLNGGTISNNKCRSLGGAIYIEGDSPAYSYTMVMNNGFISGNQAVTGANADLDMTLDGSGSLKNGGSYNNNEWLGDMDFPGKDVGNGGGVWLCPLGGTSVFTSNEGNRVIIDNNRAAKTSDKTPQQFGWGQDFYLSRGKGAALVQSLVGNWYYDNGTALGIIGGDGKVLNGPIGFVNVGDNNSAGNQPAQSGKDYDSAPGIQIINNISRDGGGIAANGTILFGEAEDVYRYEAELELEKIWDQVLLDSDKDEPVILKLKYGYDSDGNGTIEENETGNELSYENTEADGTTTKLDYQITVDGENKVDTGEDAVFYRNGEWKARALIPAYLYHDGDVSKPVELFKIKNPAGGYFDLTTRAGVKALFDHVNAQDGEANLGIEWNIYIEEEAKGANNTYTVTKRTPAASHVEIQSKPIRLIDPVTNNTVTGGSFSINFASITVGQRIINSLKDTDVTLTKKDTDGKALKGAEFKVYEAELVGSNSNNYAAIAGADNRYTPKAEVTVTSDDGSFVLKDLEPDKAYLLFETKAPAGYKKAIDPWVITIAANGDATVKTITSFGKGHYWDGSARTKYEGTEYTEELSGKSWPKTETGDRAWWRNNTGNNALVIVNERLTEIKLNKVNIGGEPVNGARFALFAMKLDKDNNNRWYYQTTFNPTGGNGVTECKQYGDEITSSNGVVDITAAVNAYYEAYPDSTINSFLLFETAVPAGSNYVRPKTPWLITLDDQGKIAFVGIHENAYADANDSEFDIYADNVTKTPKKWRWWAVDKFTGVSSKNLVNKPEPIKLTKVDGITGEKLRGTKFRIYKADQDITFDANGNLATGGGIGVQLNNYTDIDAAEGTVDLGDLTAGTYLLFETQAAPGYERSKEPWMIHINADGSYRMAVYNYEYLSFYGMKDGETKWYARTITSDAFNSWTKLRGQLENIRYYLKSGNENRFRELDGADKGKLKNTPMKLKIIKQESNVDANGKHKPLKNVEFDLYNATKKEVTENGIRHFEYQVNGDRINNDGAMVSGTDGSFKLPTLEPDHIYMLFEKEPLEGYEKPSAPWGILVDGDGVVKVYRLKKEGDNGYDASSIARYSAETQPSQVNIVCTDLIETGSYEIENDRNPIELCKLDLESVTKTYDSDNREVVTLNSDNPNYLEGVEFKLYAADPAEGSDPKTAAWSRKTPDSPVMVTGADGDGTIRTDSNGVLVLGRLDDGNYILEETKAKEGYTKPEKPWRLVVTGADAKVYVPVGSSENYFETTHNQYLTNVKIKELPKAGGSGAHWFVLIGALMIVFAVMLFLRDSRRRRRTLFGKS